MPHASTNMKSINDTHFTTMIKLLEKCCDRRMGHRFLVKATLNHIYDINLKKKRQLKLATLLASYCKRIDNMRFYCFFLFLIKLKPVPLLFKGID